MAIKSTKTDSKAPKKGVKTPKEVKISDSNPEVPKMTPVTARKKRATKATVSKSGSTLSLDAKLLVKEPVIPHGEISLRAYFIAERRQKMGWSGDAASDWADAVSQLKAEALQTPLKKR